MSDSGFELPEGLDWLDPETWPIEFKQLFEYADGTRAVGESPYIIDWKYLGKTYTWNIVGGPASRFASLGFISGRYIDKGHVGEDGKYVSDKDAAASSARTKEEA